MTVADGLLQIPVVSGWGHKCTLGSRKKRETVRDNSGYMCLNVCDLVLLLKTPGALQLWHFREP